MENYKCKSVGIVGSGIQGVCTGLQLIKKGITFIIEPYIRFKGLPGEQATMFFKDPCDNALEFKSFKDFNQIFEK